MPLAALDCLAGQKYIEIFQEEVKVSKFMFLLSLAETAVGGKYYCPIADNGLRL
jgi:hypothetical protein